MKYFDLCCEFRYKSSYLGPIISMCMPCFFGWACTFFFLRRAMSEAIGQCYTYILEAGVNEVGVVSQHEGYHGAVIQTDGQRNVV